MSRVLIISSDILPYPSFPTTGAGLRAWGIGQGLMTHGHEVIFSMPAPALEDRAGVCAEMRERAWTIGRMATVIKEVQPDVVVACNWPVAAHVHDCPVPLVLDQHGPHLLERQYQAGYRGLDDNARAKRLALSKSDFFVCAGELQRLYFLPWLMQSGYSFDDNRICSIPVSLSPDQPTHEFSDEITFVYGGVFLPWQDPRSGLDEVLNQLLQRNSGRLKFFGGRHPVYPVDTGLFESLRARLESHPRVAVQPMVAHDDLIEAYRHAHVAIDLMARNPERELAFTTRTVEYLWCGLPVIYNDYAELSRYIREYRAGWTVDPNNPAAIQAAVAEAFERPDLVREYSRNAQRLVRERLSWDRTIGPLAEFCRAPTHRVRLKMETSVSGENRSSFLIGKAWWTLRHKGVGPLIDEVKAYAQWRRELTRSK